MNLQFVASLGENTVFQVERIHAARKSTTLCKRQCTTEKPEKSADSSCVRSSLRQVFPDANLRTAIRAAVRRSENYTFNLD